MKVLFVFGEIKSYGSLLHAMKAMPCSDSVFIKKLHGFSDAGFYTLSENEEKIYGYKNLLCSVSESKLNINGRSVCLMKNPEGTGKRTLTETVARCISSFGYPEYNTERKTIKMSLPVSEMLMMLYHAEFEKIKSLFSQLSGVMDKSCLSLCGDVRFYTEVTEVKKKALSKGTCVCYPKLSEKKHLRQKQL